MVRVRKSLAIMMFGAAMHGDSDAQFNLGIMYAKGMGGPKRAADSIKWYRLAARGGHVKAQVNLRLCLYRGTNVIRDRVEAAKWFEKAAEAGD